jgi:Tol biopolymer transport system component
MKKLSLLLVLMLSLASLSVFYLGALMIRQEADQLLLFVNREDETPKLYVFNATTGEEQFVTNVEHNDIVDWSPDGRIWILDAGESMEAGDYPLRLLNPQNGNEITISDSLRYWGCGDIISWSPGGQQLAHLMQEQDELLINVLNLKTGSSFQLPTLPYEGKLLPDWSDDGNYLILNHFRPNSSAQILRASDGQVILEAPHYFGFSPDNHYVAYADASLNLYLYQLTTGTTIATGAKVELGSNNSFYSAAQWSPSGRFIIAAVADSPNELAYYDLENVSLETIDFGKPIQFVAWTSDEAQILVYTDFDASLYNQPTSLLRYTLAIAETETLITGITNLDYWSRAYRNGDWLLIPYSIENPRLSEQVDLNMVTSNLFFLNGQEQHDFDLLVGSWWPSHDIYSLGNEQGFLIDGGDGVYHESGLYYFDSQDSSLELIDSHFERLMLPSPDGHYVAYRAWRDEHPYIYIWNSETQTSNLAFELGRDDLSFISWRGSSERYSYQTCPEG